MTTKTSNTAKLQMAASMTIFGTIAIFVRFLTLPSSIIALARALVGMLFLLSVVFLKGKRLELSAILNNALFLLLSGAFLGFNWILLFEAYRFTSIPTATLCYYMAPIFVILASPVVLKESLAGRKLLCVFAALLGVVCISGIIEQGLPSFQEGKGVLLGLAAAVLYACIVLLNKKIQNISAYDRTIVQLGISAVLLVGYCLLTVPVHSLSINANALFLLLFMGIVHTGVAYYLYFGSLDTIHGQTAAMMSYLDPIVSIATSVLILQTPLRITEALGAGLILGAAIISELPNGEKNAKKNP